MYHHLLYLHRLIGVIVISGQISPPFCELGSVATHTHTFGNKQHSWSVCNLSSRNYNGASPDMYGEQSDIIFTDVVFGILRPFLEC